MRLRITIDGQVYEAEVEVLETEEGEPQDLDGDHVPIACRTLPDAPVDSQPDEPAAQMRETICHSPVTGLVVRVNAVPGQMVHPNDVLVVLESMKMETQITAHYDATVKSVLVAEGNPVKINQPLLEFE